MKIFAHRGASAEAAENTPEAVRLALEIGVDGIEIDCLMTADSVPVVNHDDDLLKQRRARGFVRKKTWKEVKALGIPCLTEVLELIKPSSAQVILDLKPQPGWMNQGPRIIADLAQEILPPERICLSSFSLRHLRVLQERFPLLRRGFILSRTAFKLVWPVIFGRFVRVQSIHPLLGNLTTKDVERWQTQGLKVFPWVANTEAQWKRCVELGVDGFFTDDPRLAKKYLTSGLKHLST